MAKEKVFVFYSWQSDTPGACNQSLIESALTRVLDAIRADTTNPWDPELEQDARNTPGAPDIHKAIFEKINRAHTVVADVTIIGKAGERPCINPNVGIEVGYALGKIGEGRLVMLQNTHFGAQEQLPFDIKIKAVKGYSSDPSNSDRAPIRKQLETILDREIRACLALPKKPPSPVEVTLTWRKEPTSTVDHQVYVAIAQMKNVSTRILTNWQIDLRIPRELGRDGVIHGSEQDTASHEPRLFVFSSGKCAEQWKSFAPEEVRLISVGYVINADARAHPGIDKLPFKVRAFVDNDLCGTVTKTVGEMSNHLTAPSVETAPELAPAKVMADDDIVMNLKNFLVDYFDDPNRFKAIDYVEIDRRARVPEGSAKRLLPEAIKISHWRIGQTSTSKVLLTALPTNLAVAGSAPTNGRVR